jgi:uncharacterized protein YggE
MNRRFLLTGLAAALALALLAVACGGDDGGDETAAIRTQKGLAVAALSGQLSTDGAGGQSLGLVPAPGTGGDETADVDRSSGQADTGFGAPDYAPALQAGQTGITVQGYGSATTDPDSAVLEFYFSRAGEIKPFPEITPPPPFTPSTDSSSADGAEGRDAVATTTQVQQITEADLQPVIDAIVSAGVSRDDIEFIGQSYYDLYYASATLRATVNDVDIVDAVVSAAQDGASGLGDIYMNSTNVSYTVSDCTALEKAAMESAVEDAGERAAAFAEALGVGLGEIVGASHYSYSPYGGTACASNYSGPYPLAEVAYAEGATGTVQVFANVSVTYAIE